MGRKKTPTNPIVKRILEHNLSVKDIVNTPMRIEEIPFLDTYAEDLLLDLNARDPNGLSLELCMDLLTDSKEEVSFIEDVFELEDGTKFIAKTPDGKHLLFYDSYGNLIRSTDPKRESSYLMYYMPRWRNLDMGDMLILDADPIKDCEYPCNYTRFAVILASQHVRLDDSKVFRLPEPFLKDYNLSLSCKLIVAIEEDKFNNELNLTAFLPIKEHDNYIKTLLQSRPGCVCMRHLWHIHARSMNHSSDTGTGQEYGSLHLQWNVRKIHEPLPQQEIHMQMLLGQLFGRDGVRMYRTKDTCLHGDFIDFDGNHLSLINPYQNSFKIKTYKDGTERIFKKEQS